MKVTFPYKVIWSIEESLRKWRNAIFTADLKRSRNHSCLVFNAFCGKTFALVFIICLVLNTEARTCWFWLTCDLLQYSLWEKIVWLLIVFGTHSGSQNQLILNIKVPLYWRYNIILSCRIFLHSYIWRYFPPLQFHSDMGSDPTEMLWRLIYQFGLFVLKGNFHI